MREISTTVTVGVGSEIHNHDLEYRKTLKHVHEREEGIIEVIPYIPYQEQINALVKPYIDAYNAKVDARYQAAWERYNSGQIKTKPRRRDYKKISYDYYNEHLHDTYHNKYTGKEEELPMWRSIILGFGDKADRENGIITEAEACATCAKVVERFREEFPYFHLLGASIHLDEEGFYHCHIDYKPFYDNEIGQGLGFAVSHEGAMERMGLEPEQSIINGRDKVPLRFNAFRNRIYYASEDALSDCGIRLQYGVSKTKDPEKDSSKNQRLKDWQDIQDRARNLQHQKNVALDVLSGNEVSTEGLIEALEAFDKIETALEEVKNSPKAVLRNGRNVTFTAFDQMTSSVEQLQNSFVHVLHERDLALEEVEDLQAENEDWKERYSRLLKKAQQSENIAVGYKQRYQQEYQQRRQYQRRCGFLETTIDRIKAILMFVAQIIADIIDPQSAQERKLLERLERQTGMSFENIYDFTDYLESFEDKVEEDLNAKDRNTADDIEL